MMVATALFWSGAFIAGKYSGKDFSPVALTFFRFLFALPFIFAILYRRQPQAWLPRRDAWPAIIALGFGGTFLYHILFFSCLRYTTAINASLIGATNPMITTLLAAALFTEKLNSRKVSGILVSFAGVALIISNGDWQALAAFSFNIGDILMFGAVVSWAFYSVYCRKIMQKYELTPLMLTAYTFLVCTLAALPCLLWENSWTALFSAGSGAWLSILYMALFASVLGYLFQLVAIQQVGAPRTNIFINLVPVFTTIQSVLLLGEQFTLMKLVCAVSIMAGVFITTRPEKI